MSKINKIYLGDLDDVRYAKVGLNGREALADQIRLVCLDAMDLTLVLLGVDAHSADVQLSTGSEDSDCDLT
jgi:hypothetical protein